MTILITGGARRIGKLMTEHLAAAGNRVIIHFNQSEYEANELLKSLPGKGHVSIQKNLGCQDEVESLLPELKKLQCLPDVLINNASTFYQREMADFTSAELLDDYQVNFFAPLTLMRDFNNLVQKGKIINILDRRVNFIEPHSGPYLLAKKSLRDATLACSEAWAPRITVNAIAPGPVLTPGTKAKELTEPLKKFLDCIDQYMIRQITGEVIVVE
jgi:pteridine reductase